jgi:hypothetical protein
MTVSTITPSYKQLDWLRLCVASVRDQVADQLTDERPATSAPFSTLVPRLLAFPLSAFQLLRISAFSFIPRPSSEDPEVDMMLLHDIFTTW